MDFQTIEKKWQQQWQPLSKVEIDYSKPKYYLAEMFPYPSGNLHPGHLRNYAIGGALAQFKKMQGYNVLYPMGWDAFGLPAENAAITNNLLPKDWTYKNIEQMRNQLKQIGLLHDWSREVVTCSPDYYKHEQKFFLELLAKGLVYQKESIVNWDPVDQTVLANEQVIDGRGWRSGAVVEQKNLVQWFVRITAYAEELLASLDQLPGWPDNVKMMQKRWIGKSVGATIKFQLVDHQEQVSVFSTRPETIFGASFLAISPAHPLVEQLLADHQPVQQFVAKCKEGDNYLKKKDGIDTGLQVLHPFDPQRTLPVWVADFVLGEYGTGALFGCPAHDQRDYEFASAHNLPIVQVVQAADAEQIPYLIAEGQMINSQWLNGLEVSEARAAVIEQLSQKQLGQATITYRLQDWGVSRQRYWGCPIPIVYCKECSVVPEHRLPVTLPEDIVFTGKGNPLDYHPTWKHTDCPKCAKPAIRETDTLDTFFESSWYFARYCNAQSPMMTDLEACNYWLPVDKYIGGIEHAVLHLLYARFFTKVMNDLGYLNIREPFTSLIPQGMVLHVSYKDDKDNFVYPEEVEERAGQLVHKVSGTIVHKGPIEKMSKSKKNTVSLEQMLQNYGADALRLFILSDSPVDKNLEWMTQGLEGCKRFLLKLYDLADKIIALNKNSNAVPSQYDRILEEAIHRTIKHVTDEMEKAQLNKVVARIRELYNVMTAHLTTSPPALVQQAYEVILQLLYPFSPHIAEEIWHKLGHSNLLYTAPWPIYDEQYIKTTVINLPIQINGKLRAHLDVAPGLTHGEIEQMIKNSANEKLTKHLEGKTIEKIVVVQDKIVNIVII